MRLPVSRVWPQWVLAVGALLAVGGLRAGPTAVGGAPNSPAGGAPPVESAGVAVAAPLSAAVPLAAVAPPSAAEPRSAVAPLPAVSPLPAVAPLPAGVPPSEAGPPELEALQRLAPDSGAATDHSSALRQDALREVAYTLGVQAGVRWRYEVIDTRLEATQHTLDRVWDFRPLLLHDGRVAPAVVDRSEGAYRIVGPTEARQTEATYSIEQEARLLSRPPDWRDYLLHRYPAFNRPDAAMLPKNADERRIWVAAVGGGFREGVTQADRLFEVHLARLRRDYLGMARFKQLVLQGIVEVPLLAESRLGVVVNGRMLSIGERVFRIPPFTDYQPVGHWKPIIQFVPATPASAAPSVGDLEPRGRP